MRGEVSALPAGPDRIPRALDLLWRWYSGPLFAAAVDLAAVARTDAELRSSLEPVERDLGRTTVRLCRDMFAGDPEVRDFDALIEMSLATVRGLALLPILQPGGGKAARQWGYAREELIRLFTDARTTRR
jgi:hypothetical protein